MRREIAALQAEPKPFAPPTSLRRSLDVTPSTSTAGWPVFTVAPRGVAPTARVLYLHGGAYIREITRHHWKLVGHLASASASVTVPIYPLAPRGTASHVWCRARPISPNCWWHAANHWWSRAIPRAADSHSP